MGFKDFIRAKKASQQLKNQQRLERETLTARRQADRDEDELNVRKKLAAQRARSAKLREFKRGEREEKTKKFREGLSKVGAALDRVSSPPKVKRTRTVKRAKVTKRKKKRSTTKRKPVRRKTTTKRGSSPRKNTSGNSINNFFGGL